MSVLFIGHFGTVSQAVPSLLKNMGGLQIRKQIPLPGTDTHHFSNSVRGLQTPERPPWIQHRKKEMCSGVSPSDPRAAFRLHLRPELSRNPPEHQRLEEGQGAS